MRKLIVAAAAGLVLFGLSLGACGTVVTWAVGGSPANGAAGEGALSGADGLAREAGQPGQPDALAGQPDALPGRLTFDPPAVPATWVELDREASDTCPGLSWSVLAAIGRVESDSGRSTAAGVRAGANVAGAEGPMQFEPTTFAAYAVVGPDGVTPPSPYDPVDAVFTAAHLLCADGAGGPGEGGLYRAVWDYNHSTVYVETVLVLSAGLAADPALGSVPAEALSFAAAQLGVPYHWGGDSPQGGFDCSGLVQAAYRAAGIALPRVAQGQFDAGPLTGTRVGLEPGDLVFFGASPRRVSHVGIYLGDGEMIDAPHTGAVVRVEAVPTVVGAPWGSDVVAGFTRPAK